MKPETIKNLIAKPGYGFPWSSGGWVELSWDFPESPVINYSIDYQTPSEHGTIQTNSTNNSFRLGPNNMWEGTCKIRVAAINESEQGDYCDYVVCDIPETDPADK